MLRQFLAILALVTGLAAMGEPLRAAEIGVAVESAGQGGEAAPCVRVPRVLELSGEARKTRNVERLPCRRTVRTSVVPTIQLQADRARE